LARKNATFDAFRRVCYARNVFYLSSDTMIKVGKPSPEFQNLMAYHKGELQKFNSSDFKGKWWVLFFYPRDFTFICPTEIREFARLEDSFEKCGCRIVAASTDSEHSHKAWFERDLTEVSYPVLADTTHELSRLFNVLDDDGSSQRGTFIIDPEGIVRWFVVSDGSVGRSVEETHRVLKALQTGELCPVQWTPGTETLGTAS